jgi:hypothetical protein
MNSALQPGSLWPRLGFFCNFLHFKVVHRICTGEHKAQGARSHAMSHHAVSGRALAAFRDAVGSHRRPPQRKDVRTCKKQRPIWTRKATSGSQRDFFRAPSTTIGYRPLGTMAWISASAFPRFKSRRVASTSVAAALLTLAFVASCGNPQHGFSPSARSASATSTATSPVSITPTGTNTQAVLTSSPTSTAASGSTLGGAATVALSSTTASTSTPIAASASATVKPCVDVEPPPDPMWPDGNCKRWAAETTECTAAWFANFCDVSCGRCIPEGASMMSAMPPAPKPCVDAPPPDDPKWPGATCADWASQTKSCTESWFANFCDISCARCIPEGGLPVQPGPPDCSAEKLPKVSGGGGYATRYWDCCQPHCSQFNGHKCGQDGTSQTGDNNSSCNGGGSFACYDESPRAVSTCLSYGHIAKANPNCGACYRIEFTGEGQYNKDDPGSKLIKGKQMIVKVTNTGGDVAGNQFDMMIPGGGVGKFNACSRQWNASDLGAQYGGFLTDCMGTHSAKKECVLKECMKIPAGKAREGCIWFVDWLQAADNPKFNSQQTDCPF